jgi:hypothetical protein
MKEVTMRVIAGLLLIMLMTVPALATEGSGGTGDSAKPEPPSFQPGAEVELAITLTAPKGWAINYLVPLRFEFGKDYVKSDEQPDSTEFSVNKPQWDFTLDEYQKQYTASVLIQLDGKLPDGEITIPLTILSSICDDAGDACTFCTEEISVPLVVRSKAPKNEKTQAQAEGTVGYSHTLALPSIQ